jgi:uncharacterized membrane protein YfcA
MVLGYVLALCMGLALGVLGGGGSIFAVPIWVYFFHVPPVVATGYALLVVGLTAAVGMVAYARRGQVDKHALVQFALPAMAMVAFMRGFVLPRIPVSILGFSKDFWVLMFFAALMVAAGFLMLRPAAAHTEHKVSKPRVFWVVAVGVTVGAVTGLAGAGGGFLIIPALHHFYGLSMRVAVGTSLAAIAVHACVGFLGDLGAGLQVDWVLLAPFLASTVTGMLVGAYVSPHIRVHMLRTAFGVMTLGVGLFILLRESFGMFTG